jgi:hypothetical protein
MIDTRGYMTAAYIVASAIYIAYGISLWVRARKYRHPERSGRRPERSEGSR